MQNGGSFKRCTPLKEGRPDTMIIQAYMRVLRDIMTRRGISIPKLVEMVKKDGRINYNVSVYRHWIGGEAHPNTFFFSLYVMADVLDLNIMDLITVHYPEEKEVVRSVLKNPDYL